MFRTETDDLTQWADRTARPYRGASDLGENFQAAIGQVFDEESSFSKYLHSEEFRSRDKQIRGLIDDGTIPEDTYRQSMEILPRGGVKVNYDFLVNYANENLDIDEPFSTDSELIDRRNKKLDSRRQYREEIFDTATTGGKAVSFGGMFVAASLDPINIAAMMVAAPAYGTQATTRAMYTLAAARRGAVVGVAAAVPIEPFIHSWKEEIGAEYTLSDSMFNIAASGILSGGIDGFSANMAHWLRTKKLASDRAGLVEQFKKRGLDAADADTMAGFVEGVMNHPGFETTIMGHIERIEAVSTRPIREQMFQDSFPEYDSSNLEEVQVLYNNADEATLWSMDSDGNVIPGKESTKALDADAEEINTILGCIDGR